MLLHPQRKKIDQNFLLTLDRYFYMSKAVEKPKPKSVAERSKKFREKLKNNKEKHDAYLEKERERDNKRREKKKDESLASKEITIQRRRQAAERMRLYRERKKLKAQAPPRKCSNIGSYNCPQSFGKAVQRVKRSLPSSPRKRDAVVRKIICDVSTTEEVIQRLNTFSLTEATKQAVQEFYTSDEISRQSPEVRDVQQIKDKGCGEKIYRQKRHMNMTIREAYALFMNENTDIKICQSKFYECRPPHVLPTSHMPHNVCVCKYRANFSFLVEGVAKKAKEFPKNSAELLDKVCCDTSAEECMSGHCEKCMSNLQDLIPNSNLLNENTSWKKWTEVSGRLKAVIIEGTLEEAIDELNKSLKRFKTHVHIKQNQSDAFKQAKQNVEAGEIVLQIDFAENFQAVNQDEIQSAHWNQQQITIFTACAWLPEKKQCSFAIVSDFLKHDKFAVYAFIKEIIYSLKTKVGNFTLLKIFSDGAASQFKNKFTLSNLCFMPKDFGITAEWYFFATAHGKGAVDGIGPVVKRSIRSQIMQRRCTINSGEDFVSAATKTVKNINILYLSEQKLAENFNILKKRWKQVMAIPKLQSLHFFKACGEQNLSVGLTHKSAKAIVKIKKLNASDVYSEISETDWNISDEEPLSLKKRKL